jgi:ribulose-phosphate 3-epimerase
MPRIKIAASILGADYGDLNHDLQRLEPVTDVFHVDVMDGNFVPNLTFGAPVVGCIKTTVPLDCHLMVLHPALYFEAFAEAGAHTLTIHAETSKNLKKDLKAIQDLGCDAGIALNPETPVSKIEKILPLVDQVLVMSVHPGFGGQEFLPEVLPKISWIRQRFPNLDIAVDGGMNDKTAMACKAMGANIFVVGSYLLKSEDPTATAERLRTLLGEFRP